MHYATSINVAGTKSFRLSTSKLLGYYGGNAQNPPPELCKCIIPSGPNRSFVQPDQSGAESLVVAMEAGNGLYRRILEAGIKQHSYFALHIFIDEFRGNSPKDTYWKRDPFELTALPQWPGLNKAIKNSGSRYDLGKMGNHARSYKMKWPTFQLKVLADTEGKVVLSNNESKHILNTWDELFPEVIDWQNLTEHQLRTTRTLRNLFGFPRTFYGRMNDALIREAISWIPQSTVGCITHFAVIALQKYIETHNKDWFILNNKHDSFLVDCPDKDIEDCCAAARNAIEMDLTSTKGEKFKMKSGVSVGKNWGKYHPEDNPCGMKEL